MWPSDNLRKRVEHKIVQKHPKLELTLERCDDEEGKEEVMKSRMKDKKESRSDGTE